MAGNEEDKKRFDFRGIQSVIKISKNAGNKNEIPFYSVQISTSRRGFCF